MCEDIRRAPTKVHFSWMNLQSADAAQNRIFGTGGLICHHQKTYELKYRHYYSDNILNSQKDTSELKKWRMKMYERTKCCGSFSADAGRVKTAASRQAIAKIAETVSEKKIAQRLFHSKWTTLW